MPWSDLELAEVIVELRRRRGDTATIEVKAAEQGCPDLGPTLCAFGNMPDGGVIILGLDERADFAPVGLADVGGLEQAVASQARTAVVPPVTCDFQTLLVEGRDVLVCHVGGLPLTDRPARCRGQAYLRQSDGDYAMGEQEIAQIELLKTQAHRRQHADMEEVHGTSAADLDGTLLARFLDSARGSSRRLAAADDAEILKRTGVIAATGCLTLAGLYALGAYPQQFQRTLSITAAVHLPREAGARTRDLVHLDGPIPDLLDQAVQWVRRNTRNTMRYDANGHGRDEPEIPLVAVREVVANALVHRSLDPITDSKRVEIRLTDERLVITSPGGLWGVSEEQLGRPGAKSAVNIALYDICQLTRMSDGNRVIEGEGGGLLEAQSALREAGLEPARFVDSGVRFTALIQRPGPDGTPPSPPVTAVAAEVPESVSRLGANAVRIWRALDQPQALADLRARFSMTDRQLRYALQRLRDVGEVEMVGSRGVQNSVYQRSATRSEL